VNNNSVNGKRREAAFSSSVLDRVAWKARHLKGVEEKCEEKVGITSVQWRCE